MKKRMINTIILNVMSIRRAFKNVFAEIDSLEKRIEKLESGKKTYNKKEIKETE